MSERHNPYYEPEKLGLQSLSFDEPDMSYEYNTYLFVKTEDGRVFADSDSGCSCPKPFENSEGETQDEVIQKMERVEDVSMAEGMLRSWGKSWDGKRSFITAEDIRELNEWWPSITK